MRPKHKQIKYCCKKGMWGEIFKIRRERQQTLGWSRCQIVWSLLIKAHDSNSNNKTKKKEQQAEKRHQERLFDERRRWRQSERKYIATTAYKGVNNNNNNRCLLTALLSVCLPAGWLAVVPSSGLMACGGSGDWRRRRWRHPSEQQRMCWAVGCWLFSCATAATTICAYLLLDCCWWANEHMFGNMLLQHVFVDLLICSILW